MKINHQLVNQSSGNTEIYTPDEILARAREVLGSINLDPASCAAANERVGANNFFTAPSYQVRNDVNVETRHYDIQDNGLRYMWYGTVWMNPPFGSPEQPCTQGCKKKICEKRGWHTGTRLPGVGDWIDKLVAEYKDGRTKEALCINFASTSERWFVPLHSFWQCFPDGRTNYVLPNGEKYKGVTKGSVITYLGPNPAKFVVVFESLGAIRSPRVSSK